MSGPEKRYERSLFSSLVGFSGFESVSSRPVLDDPDSNGNYSVKTPNGWELANINSYQGFCMTSFNFTSFLDFLNIDFILSKNPSFSKESFKLSVSDFIVYNLYCKLII